MLIFPVILLSAANLLTIWKMDLMLSMQEKLEVATKLLSSAVTGTRKVGRAWVPETCLKLRSIGKHSMVINIQYSMVFFIIKCFSTANNII